MKRTVRTSAATLSFALLMGTGAFAQSFDLVISNGRVIDPETLYDSVANVGITDGRIVEISKDALSGAEEIDATGHVVAPGFIDTHFHWQAPLGYMFGLRDGITSSMDLEVGCAGTIIADWYSAREGTTLANYGCASSHEQARGIAIDGSDGDYLINGPIASLETRKPSGWSLTKADYTTGNEILRILNKGLQDGAIGIGSTVGYMRDGVTSREMFEVQKVAARYGRHLGAHTRFTPDDATHENLGAQEVIANALALGAPVSILHFNNPGWRLTHELIARLARSGAQCLGGNISLCRRLDHGERCLHERGQLGRPARPQVRGDGAGSDHGGFLTPRPPSMRRAKRIRRARSSSSRCPRSRMRQMADVEGHDHGQRRHGGGADLRACRHRRPADRQHPSRAVGRRGKTLRLARENDIPLMQIMSILSYTAAKHLGDTGLKAMQERGRMQEGMVADIVVFDPETVTDNSTYAEGLIPSTGFKAVVVNGQVGVRDDEVLGVFAGQPIRFEPRRTRGSSR